VKITNQGREPLGREKNYGLLNRRCRNNFKPAPFEGTG
jgi:hypothetical protein